MKSRLFLKENQVYVFGREPLRVDVLTGVSGLQFDVCFARRRDVIWDGVKVPLVSLDDLRLNKMASGRPKDLADLAGLPINENELNSQKPSRKRKRKS
ncbi:MAG TPA: hypothetical protein VHZ30_01265 [Verrucomicrobiae bacterium]|nr:hypothetical protein [Verrucomicrobiae bacterium]